jgi:hypothetical protein
MREMDLWDIAAYWYLASLMQEQFDHFRVNFFTTGSMGLEGWTFT